MTERDPRIDPSFLDVVYNGKKSRQVELVTVLGTVVYSTGAYHAKEGRCSLESWKRWCKGARVKRRGPELTHDHPITAMVDQATLRSLNAARNRLIGSSDFYPDEEDVTAALLKLALAVIENAGRSTFTAEDLNRVLGEAAK